MEKDSFLMGELKKIIEKYEIKTPLESFQRPMASQFPNQTTFVPTPYDQLPKCARQNALRTS